MPEFSNDHENLVGRLLGLFPIAIVKQEFDKTGSATKVYSEIAKANTMRDINEDAFRLFGYARQHCYFFRHTEKDLLKQTTDFFPDAVHYKNIFKQEKNLLIVEYLLELDYQFWEINNRTADKKPLRYLWPVRIVMRPEILQVRFVIMEKNQRSTERFVYYGRDLDEDTIVKAAVSAVPSARIDQAIDLNKGVKSLWNDDEIDATEVAHKSSASVDRAIMDAGLTFKQTYPERYREIIKHPLRKMMFYILKNKKWPFIFLVDPTEGFVSFFRFQPDPEGVDEMVGELLGRNT